MTDLTKNDIEWLERHGFKLNYIAKCYQRFVGEEKIYMYYSENLKAVACVCSRSETGHGEGETAEEAFLDFLQKHKTHIEELQSFQNELAKI